MAATAWAYFTPYREDPAEALRALQAWCLDSARHKARFANRQARIDDMQVALRKLMTDDTPVGGMFRDEMLARLIAIQERPEPDSFEEALNELRWLNAEAGTHSPIDLLGVANREAHLRAAPLTDDALRKLFGHERPDKAQITAAINPILNLRDANQGTYVVAWAAGQPVEILFCGATGV